MEEIKLEAKTRDQIGSPKSRKLKRNGFIPGVIYGGSTRATAIQVERRTFERIIRLHQGQNVIFQLNVLEENQKDKKAKEYSAITKEMQYDPVTDEVIHVDFQRISLTEKIEVEVNIVTKGEAIGVKQDGGSVEHVMWKLDVICLPTNIPSHIEVDISQLKIHDSVFVKDLVLSEGVITKHDLEAIVLTIVPPMKEIKPEEVAEAASPTEPEVIKEKPKEKKEGEATPGTKKPAETAPPKPEAKS